MIMVNTILLFFVKKEAIFPGKHEVFPIPQQEIDISGLEQNPSY